MANYNKVILVGNITRDPELRHIPSGTAVTDLGLAVNRTWTDRNTNQRNEETTFVDVTCWGRTAEIACEYLHKGRPVLKKEDNGVCLYHFEAKAAWRLGGGHCPDDVSGTAATSAAVGRGGQGRTQHHQGGEGDTS